MAARSRKRLPGASPLPCPNSCQSNHPLKSHWPLNPEIKLTFNQPMDQASVEANFSLIGPDGAVPGKITWDEDLTILTFTPDSLLPRNTSYTLTLNGQAQARGGSQLGESLSAEVITVPDLSVTNTEPAQGGSTDVNTGVTLYFSAPLPGQDLSKYFSIAPAVSNFQISPDQTTVHVWGSFTPTTDYVIKVSPTLTDTWGGALGQEYSFAFRTNDLQPNVSILTSADAIFLTPQDISLIVQAVNIPEIPLTVGSVPMEDLFKLLGPQGYELRNTYQPANPVSWTQTLAWRPTRTRPSRSSCRRTKNRLLQVSIRCIWISHRHRTPRLRTSMPAHTWWW